ncbi:hypothetical protein MHYP_G00338860 [Metynnis hypsauchen]
MGRSSGTKTARTSLSRQMDGMQMSSSWWAGLTADCSSVNPFSARPNTASRACVMGANGSRSRRLLCLLCSAPANGPVAPQPTWKLPKSVAAGRAQSNMSHH